MTYDSATDQNGLWEGISTGDFSTPRNGVEMTTARLPVPGGWIYRTTIFSEGKGGDLFFVSTVFVPFARYTGAELADRLATSPHAPQATKKTEGGIPDFSSPPPKRGGGFV